MDSNEKSTIILTKWKTNHECIFLEEVVQYFLDNHENDNQIKDTNNQNEMKEKCKKGIVTYHTKIIKIQNHGIIDINDHYFLYYWFVKF